MREPKGTVGAVKAMKHDSSPTRAMRDPKGTAGAGEEMKQASLCKKQKNTMFRNY
ncbi:hypothetical protein HPP92_011829 [Vanilla planifolia]|uniref:Uncharacterized protein n=1 Tax=Vanilla planifolia TaxID=51239 RepID=A0A835V4S7_VANPL|nr:hypothetical protein HPP92_011829 [Vanilla planifolia]